MRLIDLLNSMTESDVSWEIFERLALKINHPVLRCTRLILTLSGR